MFKRLMFGITMAALAVLSLAMWRALDAPVRAFVIEGDLTAMEQREIRQQLSSYAYEGVLSIDLHAVRALLEHLPWARDVSIRRSWPDKIVVAMHRARPVARWGEDRYLSAYGDLMNLPDDYAGLPQFVVAMSSPPQAMEVYRLLDRIVARAGLSISRLQQNEQGEWSIDLHAGPRVLLGAQQLNERMHRFLLVHRRVLQEDKRGAKYVDARYANGVAVRFMETEVADEMRDEMLVAHNSRSTNAEGQN